MAHLIRMPRATWRRQPQGVISANQGPFATGLLTLVSGSSLMDVAKNIVCISSTTTKSYSQGVSARIQTVGPNYVGTTAPQTILFYGALISSVGANPSFLFSRNWYWNTSADNAGFGIWLFYNSGANQLAGALWNNNNDLSLLTTQTITIGNTFVAALTYNGTIATVYYNGNNIKSSLTTTGYKNAGGNFVSGYLDSKGSTTTLMSAGWDRCLSSAEIKAISENPWQLFSPAPARFILIPSAGGGPTTHDVALLLAANTAFAPVGNANFNAGLTLSTLAGALSGKNAQYNTNLTLQTNVSMTLAKAMQALAEIQVGMTLDQQLSATNAAVAAITESIACSHTSTVTANLLAGLSFAISQNLTSTTGGTVAAALSLALQSALSPSVTAGWATNALLAATLQSTLTSTLATSAALALPATLTVTIDGERLTSGDVGLVLSMQAGLTTSATAILGAHVALATQLLATPAAAGSFATALSLANTLSTQFDFGNTISSALSLAMSLSLAEAAAVSLGGQLTLGTVLSEAQSVVAALTANASFPVSLAAPISGSVAMEAGVSLDWTLSFSNEGAFFAITVSLPTGRIVKILASEHMVNITASERMVNIPLSNSFTSVN